MVATCQILSAKTESIWQRASKVQQPLLERPSEMKKLRCITNLGHSLVAKITAIFFSRILSDREYLLTEPWSAIIVDEVIKEVQKCSILVP